MLLLERTCLTLSASKPDSGLLRMSRRVFSFPVMLGTLLVVLTVLTVRARFSDPDLWWHLKVGEIIWNTHTIPTTDQFSFTTNNHPWIPHEWLSEVLIYGAYRVGGYTGLMAWLCVFPSLLMIAAYTLSSLYSGNAKVALLGALITWLCATVGLAIRPHVIGYLFLITELLIVHFGRSRNSRWFLALPPLFAMWVNCHGSFVFGLGVLAVFLFCSFITMETGSLVCIPWKKNERNLLMLSVVLSLAALFINPMGLKQVLYPVNVMTNLPDNLKFISEWQALRFDEPRDFIFLAIAGLIVLLLIVRSIKIRLPELLLLAISFEMAIRHSRMLFVFGIIAAPIVCRLMADLWDNYEASRDRIPSERRHVAPVNDGNCHWIPPLIRPRTASTSSQSNKCGEFHASPQVVGPNA